MRGLCNQIPLAFAAETGATTPADALPMTTAAATAGTAGRAALERDSGFLLRAAEGAAEGAAAALEAPALEAAAAASAAAAI